MSKNESKIPLVLALLGLGYIVFRAVNYVNDFRSHQAAVPTPVVAQAQTPAQPEQASIAEQAPTPQTVADNKGQPVSATGATDVNMTNSDEVPDTIAPDQVGQTNRKLWGIVREGKRKG